MLFLCSSRDSSWVPIDGETALNHDLPMVRYTENGPQYGTFRTLFDQDETKLLALFSKEELQNKYEFASRKNLVVSKYREGYGWEKFFPLQFSVEILHITAQRNVDSSHLRSDEFNIECYAPRGGITYGGFGLLDFLDGNIFKHCPLAAYRLRFKDRDDRNRLVVNPNYQVR